jgi:DNA-binding SARP family transcriptional activator
MDFRVLGTLEVWTDAGRVMLPSPRHQRVLAALLLAPNSVVPIARLADAVWHDEPPMTATKQIQNCVSVLRERLGRERDVIITDGPGYRLSIVDDELDAIRFQRGVVVAQKFAAEGSLRRAVGTARDALRLWRGPALDGLDAVALAGPVTKLNEQRYNAVEMCAEWQLQLGEHQTVIEELGELVAFHPLRERMHGQLMTALDGCRRPADALAVFSALRARLVNELGVEPGPELRAQQARILAGTRGRSSPAPPVSADRAPRQLAAAVTRQWTTEVEMRSLNRPEPVPLTWSSTGRPVTAGAALTRRNVASRGERLVFSGDLRDVVAKFRQVRSRQLVVLGDPGAGKSVLAMLFTLGLLADRREGEPVPVLLPLASWNPHREHLRHWLATKLVEDYPGLANKAVYGADAATRLVSDRKIVPVLDGLDEIPPALHAAAIDALDRAVADGSPLVMTCRATEYEQAVTQSGSVLAGAAVVEIEPVEAEAAIEFLTARTRAGETRWQPVEQRLRRQTDSPLALALRTPLMVDLTRTAYAHPNTDPGELCDTDRFGGPELIEDHLLDAYLPASYAHRPTPPAPDGRPDTPRTYDPPQAERWLRFLARRMQDQQTRDLAWWRLDRMMPRHVAGLYLGLPPALLFAATGWVAAGPAAGLVYGLSFGLAGWLAQTIGDRPGPLRVELRFRRTTSRFLRRFLVGAVAGSLLALGWSLSPPVIALLAVVFGLAIAPHVWLDTPIDAATVTSPATVLRSDRTAALAYTLSFVMCMGPFWGIAFALTNETRFVTVLGGDFDLVLALATGLACGLLGRFMLGTAGSIAYGLAGAAVGGQELPRATSATQAIIAGILFGLAVGLAVCLARAWGAFTMMRLWLAARGHLPWHLMGFLADAHRRGVLRQVGGTYQFRHVRLQARLAGQTEPPAHS